MGAFIGFICGGIVGIVIIYLCNRSEEYDGDYDDYDEEDDKGEW